MNQSRKWLLAVFVLAALLRLLVFATVYPDETRFRQPDSGGYDRPAVNLMEHHVYSISCNPPFEPYAYRVPVYSVFLAFVYAILGHHPPMAILFQIAINLVALYVTYRIGMMLFNRAVGVMAAGALAVDIGQVLYSNQLLTETLFTLLLSLSIYSLLRFLEKERTGNGILTGIFMGLAALCRPIALYLPILLVAVFLIWFRADLLLGFKRYVLIVCCFMLVLMPWLARNYHFFGVLQLNSSQGDTFLFYNAAYLRARVEGVTYAEARKELKQAVQDGVEKQDLNPMEVSVLYQRRAVEEILQHPLDYAIVHLSGVVPLLMLPNTNVAAYMLGIPASHTDFIANFLTRGLTANASEFHKVYMEFLKSSGGQLIFILAFLIEVGALVGTYLLIVYGLWTSQRRRKLAAILVLGTVLLYLALATGPVGRGRFRVPMMPYLYLLASHGLHNFLGRKTTTLTDHPQSHALLLRKR